MWVFLACALALACAAPTVTPVSITVSSNEAPVHRVDPEYLSFNLDYHLPTEETPAWNNSNVLTMALFEDKDLTFLASQLTPGHLRVGGSEGDDVVYETPGVPCPPNTQWCLTMARWAELNAWATAGNFTIAYGLNAMAGRANKTSRMDLTNLAAFLEYAASSNTTTALRYFEFGNELEYKADPAPYAADLLAVSALIEKYWPNAATRPRLVSNDENPNPSYWSQFFPLVPAGVISAGTWHQYLDIGLDVNLTIKAMNPVFLASTSSNAEHQVKAARTAGFTGDFWVGETALAWHSGRNGTTNTFYSCPWYVTQLGLLASTHSVQCRQALMGGYYELVDKWTHTPNPDWWVAHLWKRTMGTGVLNVTANASIATGLFVFAHCGVGNSGVTLAFASVSPNVTFALDVADTIGSPLTVPRFEYHITPNGPLSSQSVLLNGKPLTYGGPGVLDPANPVKVTDPAAPLLIAPQSVGFIVFPNAPNSC